MLATSVDGQIHKLQESRTALVVVQRRERVAVYPVVIFIWSVP
jgi:hypothetical protein